MRSEDVAYVQGAWSEAFKGSSNRMHKMTWGRFKTDVRPALHAILARSEVLVAELDGAIVGWIALVRGPRVDTVHWIQTRLCVDGGPVLRRHGIMRALVEQARLKDRIVYTHRGAKRSDEWIARWLRTRGAISVVFTPYEEWR